MKVTLFIFLELFILANNLFSQNITTVKGTLKKHVASPLLFTKIDTSNCQLDYSEIEIAKARDYFIIEDTGCILTKQRWYVVVVNKAKYLFDKFFFQDVQHLDSMLNSIKIIYPDISDRYRFAIEKIDKIETERISEDQKTLVEVNKQLDSLVKVIDKRLEELKTKNIVVWDWSWTYANEYSSFVDISITVINPYSKKIKYIWFTFQGFNPVNDIIRDGITGKTEKTVQGIGPIDYSEKGSYNFESVLYSKVVESMKIKQIKIQFFDGTVKVISNPKSLNIVTEPED